MLWEVLFSWASRTRIARLTVNLWITFKIICLIQRLKEVRKEKKTVFQGDMSLLTDSISGCEEVETCLSFKTL